MANESKEKIDSTNDELEKLESEEDESEEDEEDESENDSDESDEDDSKSDDEDEKENKKTKKNSETPEDKRARLKRMLSQQEKKMGLKSEDGKPVVKKKGTESSLSQADLYILLRNDVADEDVSEVTDYAKLKGISVKEALNAPIVKSILKERKEERETADATNTSTSRRSNSKPTSDALLADAQKGKMPESDSDIKALIKARKKGYK